MTRKSAKTTPADDTQAAEGVSVSDVTAKQETHEDAVDLDCRKRAAEKRRFEATSTVRDLIKELRHVPASSIIPNPKNYSSVVD